MLSVKGYINTPKYYTHIMFASDIATAKQIKFIQIHKIKNQVP